MAPHKGHNIIKYCVVTSTTALILMTISIFPLAKKAFRWNMCFDNTLSWINEKEEPLKDWDLPTKKSLAVSVCNGGVFETYLE